MRALDTITAIAERDRRSIKFRNRTEKNKTTADPEPDRDPGLRHQFAPAFNAHQAEDFKDASTQSLRPRATGNRARREEVTTQCRPARTGAAVSVAVLEVTLLTFTRQLLRLGNLLGCHQIGNRIA